MIKVRKSPNAPSSLLDPKKDYNEEDVNKQLIEDQYDKCYICERKTVTDYTIEHRQSKRKYPELRKDWHNLLLACTYCNTKKGEDFEDILDPEHEAIEDEIKQSIDFVGKRAVFTPAADDRRHKETARLLERIFNGKGAGRVIREERLFDYAVMTVSAFYNLAQRYSIEPNEDDEMAIREKLDISSEFLGFKYWIVKSSPTLCEKFGMYMKWNKVKKPLLLARP